MINRKWFQLNQSLIQVYTQSQIAYKYKKLPLQYFHIAIAKFSGPIAVLYNKYLAQQVQVKLSQQDENCIIIFNPKGELKRTIPFQMKDRVILFQFNQVEELVVLYASGEYVIVDPFSGKKYQGTFFIGQDEINKTTNERCIGAVFEGEQLLVIREKQFGIVKSFKNYWTALPNLKPNIQNPIFALENLSCEKKRMGTSIGSLVYLSRENTIQEYNLSTNIKRIIFQGQLLKSSSKNLQCLSKRQNILILIFKNPFKILYITLTELNLKIIPHTTTHQPLIQLKQRVQISKKKSKHNYMSLNHQIIWLGQSKIAAYNNGKMLMIFDSQNIKAIYNQHTESRMIHSVVEEIDGFRVVGEEHTLYRQVNLVYQELVSLESLEEAQYKIFAHNQQVAKEKQLLREKLLANKVQQFELTPKQKGLIIHQLHQIYQKYINKQMIPISDLNSLKGFAGSMLKQIIQNGVKCLDNLELVKIMNFATFVQNYFSFGGVTKKDRQSDIRMSQLKLMDSEDNLTLGSGGNLFQYLSTPIHELCSQLRILNALKYASMKRFLTIEEFHYLKYDLKDKFIEIMLRYNMHYELDLIFGDSEAKAKIFYHWAKCKIEKESPSQERIEDSNNQGFDNIATTKNQSADSLVFQTIIEKYDTLKDKFYPNNNLFSQLAKYCVDRNKLSLGLKLLQHQQDPQKKALVGLLILVAKRDKHLVQKVLQFTQRSKKSPIVYRVIKQLLNQTWIQKHIWTNLFHNRFVIQQHFIKYNEFIYMWDNVKDYFLQNKMLVDLGYMGMRQTIWAEAKEIVASEEIQRTDVRTMCLFNGEENQEIKNKIVNEFQALVPNICLALKKHINKPKSGLQILKKFKKQPHPIIQDDIDQVLTSLNDKELQYLGQIILQKDQNKQLATYVFMKIKSEKSYRILLKQGKYKEAIDLALERRNTMMLREILETIKLVTQQSEEDFLMEYGSGKLKELQNKPMK